MPTPKQEKLIKLLFENVGKSGNTKTFEQMMLEAADDLEFEKAAQYRDILKTLA